ncbi:MAG TPA: cytochrome C oxidase subunit IV family protein [Tepidisphaeraceae bacterium]|jgi:cytochrome c oxidase subunit 4|nr:cytochrome C oxidase subunit IV family protein [Tepidisphaeraceae bacterium]
MPQTQHKIDGIPLYLLIYCLLMALLVSTVIAATFDMGRWNVVAALTIAVLKALLVILFFMHIRHSSRLTWIFAAAAFLWLGLLLGLTMTDYTSRTSPAPNSNAQISLTAAIR